MGNVRDRARLRVVVADDHEPMRELLQAELEDAGMAVVGSVADGSAAVELAARERPDLCILDVRMPGMSGIEAARRISADVPETRILMLTVAPNDEDERASAEAGAHGYVGKDAEAGGLPALAEELVAGETRFPSLERLPT